MRWLVHGTMTSAVASALKAREDKVVLPAEAGLAADAPASLVLDAARAQQLDICTDDAALAEAAAHAKPLNRSVVYLQLEGGDVEQDDAIGRLFVRYKRLTPNRLYTVTGSRVKIRQLPGS